jgi:hypothetical protein
VRKLVVIIATWLLLAAPAAAEEKYGGAAIYNLTTGGTTLPIPSSDGEMLGSFGGSAVWQTMLGQCQLVSPTSTTVSITCPSLATVSSPTFTGTVGMPSGSWTNAGINNIAGLSIGPLGGQTNQFPLNIQNAAAGTYAININNTNTCATCYAGIVFQNGSGYGQIAVVNQNIVGTNPPAGSLWVLSLGSIYINTNTSTQPITFATGGSTRMTISATGISAGGMSLVTPLAPPSGGLGTGTAPTAGQIPVGQTGGIYLPQTLSGDVTIAATGATTVSGIGGVAPGNIYPLNVGAGLIAGGGYLGIQAPIPLAAGGLGTAPVVANAGWILMGQSTSGYQGVPLTGDITITPAGVSRVLTIAGQPIGGNCPNNQAVISINGSGQPTCGPVGQGTGVPPGGPLQLVGYTNDNPPVPTNVVLVDSLSNGQCHITSSPVNGQYALNCPGYISTANSIFTGTTTFPDGARWTNQGIVGVANITGNGMISMASLNISGNSNFSGATTVQDLIVMGTCTGCNNTKHASYEVLIHGLQDQIDDLRNIIYNGDGVRATRPGGPARTTGGCSSIDESIARSGL